MRNATGAAAVSGDKREAILAAALALFNERSFNGTPMPLVAERAGVGAGTIYRYFESKDALGNAVFQDCKLALQHQLAARLRRGLTPRQEFEAMWNGLWEFFTANPAAFQFLETHNHGSYLDPASRATSDAQFDAIVGFVHRGQAAGAIRAAHPGLLIAMAFGAFIGLVKEAEAGRFSLDDQTIAAAGALVWTMLRNPRRTPRRQSRRNGR